MGLWRNILVDIALHYFLFFSPSMPFWLIFLFIIIFFHQCYFGWYFPSLFFIYYLFIVSFINAILVDISLHYFYLFFFFITAILWLLIYLILLILKVFIYRLPVDWERERINVVMLLQMLHRGLIKVQYYGNLCFVLSFY